MLVRALLFATVALTASAAQAGSQSSNTSSNSSSNNGVVRERIVDSYCEDGRCTRSVERRTFRDAPRDRQYRARRDAEARYLRDRRNDDDDDD